VWPSLRTSTGGGWGANGAEQAEKQSRWPAGISGRLSFCAGGLRCGGCERASGMRRRQASGQAGAE